MAVTAAPATAAATPLRDANAAWRTPRRLLLQVADATPFAFIVAMWMNQAASAAAVAARVAFGEGSRAAGLAKEAAYASFLIMVALLPLAHQRMVKKLNVERRRFVPALIGLRRDGRVASAPVMVIVSCCVFILMSLLIQWLVAPPKGSDLEMVRVGLCDAGSFLASVTMCSIILPNFIILLKAPAT